MKKGLAFASPFFMESFYFLTGGVNPP
jgi:hypothetical protein